MLILCEPCAGVAEEEVSALTEAIASASCPEEAARQGRRAQRCQPHLVRPDWNTAKLAVMQAALHTKVSHLSLGLFSPLLHGSFSQLPAPCYFSVISFRDRSQYHSSSRR